MWVASDKLMCIANVQARVMKPIGSGAMLRIGHAPQRWYLGRFQQGDCTCAECRWCAGHDGKYTGTVLHCAVPGLVLLSLAPT